MKSGAYRNIEKRNGKLVFVDKGLNKQKKPIEKVKSLSPNQTSKVKFASPFIDYSPRRITLKANENLMIDRVEIAPLLGVNKVYGKITLDAAGEIYELEHLVGNGYDDAVDVFGSGNDKKTIAL
jgi:hypothetical protein